MQPPDEQGAHQPQDPFDNSRGSRHHWHRRGGVGGGVILVVLGAVFLLANLGLLEGVRWNVVWPVVLIAIGLWLIFRRLR